MNRFRRYTIMAALASFISTGSIMISMAGTKVMKNTAIWVEEAKRREEETRATEEMKAAEEAIVATATEAAVVQKTSTRQQVVDCALSFVGSRYVWDGTGLHSSVDCSDSTRYILNHAGGVSIGRSSAERAGEGRAVTADSMQPGDLFFYSKGGGVNHVTMYVGNGQVVHASSSKTSTIVSTWNYRTPVHIASYLN